MLPRYDKAASEGGHWGVRGGANHLEKYFQSYIVLKQQFVILLLDLLASQGALRHSLTDDELIITKNEFRSNQICHQIWHQICHRLRSNIQACSHWNYPSHFQFYLFLYLPAHVDAFSLMICNFWHFFYKIKVGNKSGSKMGTNWNLDEGKMW